MHSESRRPRPPNTAKAVIPPIQSERRLPDGCGSTPDEEVVAVKDGAAPAGPAMLVPPLDDPPSAWERSSCRGQARRSDLFRSHTLGVALSPAGITECGVGKNDPCASRPRSGWVRLLGGRASQNRQLHGRLRHGFAERKKLHSDFVNALRPRIRIQAKAAVDKAGETFRHDRIQYARRGEFEGGMGWVLAREQVMQGRAERVDVRPGVGLVSSELFRRGIPDAPEQVGILHCPRLKAARDPEIDQADPTIGLDHYVGRLEIAEDYRRLLAMQVSEDVGDL